jgi:hypothetical protein
MHVRVAVKALKWGMVALPRDGMLYPGVSLSYEEQCFIIAALHCLESGAQHRHLRGVSSANCPVGKLRSFRCSAARVVKRWGQDD